MRYVTLLIMCAVYTDNVITEFNCNVNDIPYLVMEKHTIV